MTKIKTFDKSKFRYRLGDIILTAGIGCLDITHPDSPFVDSIAFDYIMETHSTGIYLNFDLLHRIVNDKIEKKSYPIPDDSELVLHIRAGDRNRLNNDQVVNVFNTIKKIIESNTINKITIVTAFHYGNAESKTDIDIAVNNDTLNKLIECINTLNVPLLIKSTSDIDEDFCYLVKANHLLITKGSFSVLAALVNKNNIFFGVDFYKREYDKLIKQQMAHTTEEDIKFANLVCISPRQAVLARCRKTVGASAKRRYFNSRRR